MLDFGHPLTTELFDRTVEQREQRTAIVVELRKSGDQDNIDARANEVMFARFGEDVANIVALRVQELKDQTGIEVGELLDISAHKEAEHMVKSDLAELNRVMPLPGLERIAQQQ